MRRTITAAVAAISLLAVGLSAPASASPAIPAGMVALKTPPALLPWGVPAASKAAKFTSAAKPATGVQRTLPKGSPGIQPLGKSALLGPYFFYNAGQQIIAETGISAMGLISKPVVASGDHSLGELTVQRSQGGTRNIVEVGWTVDPALHSGCTPAPACTTEPYLFSYWWKNGVGQGYDNVAGYTDWPTNPINIGSKLTNGDNKKFGITFSDGAWFLAYDTDWVGYYLETNWTGTALGGAAVPGGFHVSDAVQAFGEVASGSNAMPTTDMGTGVLGNATTGTPSKWSSVTYASGSAAVNLGYSNSPSNPTKYTYGNYTPASVRSFKFGGPGW